MSLGTRTHDRLTTVGLTGAAFQFGAMQPNIGSAVAFFNTTTNAKGVLNAWAQAMAYPKNHKAPDDQVLDALLNQGTWLRRASFGWLPAAYLRMMPAYYRGVVPVIEHDHGSAPGLLKHSEAKPVYPPVKDMELCLPNDPENEGMRPYVSEENAEKEARALQEAEEDCRMHGRNCDAMVEVANNATADPPEPTTATAPTPVPVPEAPEAPEAPKIGEVPTAPTPLPRRDSGVQIPVPVAQPAQDPPMGAAAPTPVPMCDAAGDPCTPGALLCDLPCSAVKNNPENFGDEDSPASGQ